MALFCVEPALFNFAWRCFVVRAPFNPLDTDPKKHRRSDISRQNEQRLNLGNKDCV
jgi:hypothetical protein